MDLNGNRDLQKLSNIGCLRSNKFNDYMQRVNLKMDGDALITSLRDKSLRKIKFKDNKFLNEKVIFKDNIGRIRDIEIQKIQENFSFIRSRFLFGDYKSEKNIYTYR